MEDEGIAVVSWEIGGERDESGDWREREREEKKVEAYTLLHKDAFVQQSAWEKCALCHKTMSFF